MNWCRRHRWWGTDGRCPECDPPTGAGALYLMGKYPGVVDHGDPYDPTTALPGPREWRVVTERIGGTVKLYELAPVYRCVAEHLAALGEGDVAPGPDHDALEAQALANLEAVAETFDVKAQNVALVVRELEVEAAAIQAEADRLVTRAKARENAARRLKDYLKANMVVAGLTKVAGKLATVTLVNNGRPSIAWARPLDDLPAEFKRLTVALDGAKAWETLKADGCLPDGFDVVHGQHVRIR